VIFGAPPQQRSPGRSAHQGVGGVAKHGCYRAAERRVRLGSENLSGTQPGHAPEAFYTTYSKYGDFSPKGGLNASPQRGGSRSSRTRGGMRWTRQRRARLVFAGRGSRERSNRVQTNGASTSLPKCGRRHMAGLWIGEDRCGRQNRVVLAPVAGAKSAEATSAQPGLTSHIRR
jgi:hypothetical protein